jgi:Nucleotide modification associated domain 2
MVDGGAAPCVQAGVLSLAICKPMIRGGAQEGDLVFGFMASSRNTRSPLIYAARVTKKLTDGEYYKGDKYKERPDCIYQYKQGRYTRRKGAKFHEKPTDLIHDLGQHPEYDRANVLLSSDFRYFGANGTDEYKSKFQLIRNAVEALGRGQRVNHTPELRDQFAALQEWLWRINKGKVLGQPSDRPSGSSCHRAKSCGVL